MRNGGQKCRPDSSWWDGAKVVRKVIGGVSGSRVKNRDNTSESWVGQTQGVLPSTRKSRPKFFFLRSQTYVLVNQTPKSEILAKVFLGTRGWGTFLEYGILKSIINENKKTGLSPRCEPGEGEVSRSWRKRNLLPLRRTSVSPKVEPTGDLFNGFFGWKTRVGRLGCRQSTSPGRHLPVNRGNGRRLVTRPLFRK